MKRSKLVCLSLSLLVSIGLLAGCGGEKKEAGKASETVLKIGHVEPTGLHIKHSSTSKRK
ncbi:hypothetical protein [Acidaminococcus intestini]|uniref:hypothetical protein n=1 Tax=Acidaminococcus intestini TaxID=187327 RepID=UPI00265D2CC3|nr:hypothetical protein [Acidaminococcus intestini]